MKPIDPSLHDQVAEARLAALLLAARQAPLPRGADQLSIGFGARAEARLRATAAEASMVSRFLWRWVTGLGACAVLAVAAASLTAATPRAAASSTDSTFQSDWASYTAVPEWLTE